MRRRALLSHVAQLHREWPDAANPGETPFLSPTPARCADQFARRARIPPPIPLSSRVQSSRSRRVRSVPLACFAFSLQAVRVAGAAHALAGRCPRQVIDTACAHSWVRIHA